MTPRETFIEATRKVLEACPCISGDAPCSPCWRRTVINGVRSHFADCRWPGHAAVLAQVEAFADQECERMGHDIVTLHASCRAALRKECEM